MATFGRYCDFYDITYNKYLEGTLALTAEKMRLDKSAHQNRRLRPDTFISQPPSPLHGFHAMADQNTDVMIQHSAEVRGGVGVGLMEGFYPTRSHLLTKKKS